MEIFLFLSKPREKCNLGSFEVDVLTLIWDKCNDVGLYLLDIVAYSVLCAMM